MSNNVLTADPNQGWTEDLAEDTLRSGLQRGYVARRSRQSEDRFEGRYVFDFGPTGNTHSTFMDFFRARRGGYDSFLWKPRTYSYSHVDAEALGTGDGATTPFTLDMVHIDSTELVVYFDSVSQGSGWSLSSNNTTPMIVFTSGPSAGTVITADYEYYYPVTMPDRHSVRARSNDLTSNQLLRSMPVAFIQNYPGSHSA